MEALVAIVKLVGPPAGVACVLSWMFIGLIRDIIKDNTKAQKETAAALLEVNKTNAALCAGLDAIIAWMERHRNGKPD